LSFFEDDLRTNRFSLDDVLLTNCLHEEEVIACCCLPLFGWVVDEVNEWEEETPSNYYNIINC
jgi:hypothetical protein